MATNLEQANKARKANIAKSNDLIQKSQYSLSLIQNKLLLYMLSKVKINDSPDKRYKVDCSEFSYLVQSKHKDYGWLKKEIKNLADQSWWYFDPETGRNSLMRWLNTVDLTLSRGSAFVEVSFHETVHPFILRLQEKKQLSKTYYTTYTFEKVALMKHKHSPRMYEILKSYQYNNKKWKFEIGTGSRWDLQLLLCELDADGEEPIIPGNWKNFGKFKAEVLEPAKREINEYTDLNIDYRPSKEDFSGERHRSFCSIEFFLNKKDAEETRELEKMYQTSYEDFDRELNGMRGRVKDNIPGERESEPDPGSCSAVKEHAALEGFLRGFSADEIDNLYNISVLRLRATSKLESAIEEYVKYYYAKIESSPNETRTSAYLRLKDLLLKDYDGIIPVIDDKYADAREESPAEAPRPGRISSIFNKGNPRFGEAPSRTDYNKLVEEELMADLEEKPVGAE